MKRIAFLIVGVVISIVSLYLALQGFHWDQLWQAIGNMQIIFILLMVIPYILTFMTKVWRWRVLFHPDEAKYSTSALFSSLMISYVPLPFRAGEVARGVVIGAKTNTPIARVFSTIFVEKVLDVLTLMLLLGISLSIGGLGLPNELQSSANVLGLVFLVIAVALLVLIARPALLRNLSHFAAKRLPERFAPRLEEGTEHILQGLAPLANPPIALKLGLWSLASWSVNSVTIYLMLRAFNLEVPPMAAVVLVVATNLGMAVPSAPGYVGTFELVVVLALKALGIPEPQAQTFALVYHFIGLVPVALIGIFSVVQQGLGFAVFRSNQNTPPPPTPPTPPAPPIVPATAIHTPTRDKR